MGDDSTKPGLLTSQQSVPVVDTPPTFSIPIKMSGLVVKEKASKPVKEKQRWNTHNLGQRIGVDALSAASAGGLVSPIICIIDRAIIENASGRQPMMQSVRSSISSLVTTPHKFLSSRPFLLIYLLYSGTYFAANTLDTVKSTMGNKIASTTTTGPAKFIATSTTNLSLCLYKDSQFTRMFGTVSPRPVPPVTYGLFAIRDCLTIFASFNLPAKLAPVLPLSTTAESYMSRASAAQFIAPAAIQLLSTPFHLLGLDLYNRNGGTKLSDRLQKVRVDWLKSSIARMCRIIPAFGVGGVVNNGMRKRGMTALE